ncbi:MAG: nicotinate-nucleotide--dimethylbenzimidazole phosphoribosyltransferase [Ruminiclostridium sp.]|nr:nicotinate-nucleotide--dimethylbenzimidazole phosphoribosyltransferase [Ruminiclostridium sp.]
MNRITEIRPSDKAAYNAAKERWDSIAKPLGSLGIFEDAICRIAAVQGSPDVDISRRTAVVFCADNGVVCEGVSQSDSSVTALCAREIAEGRSNINALARTYKADVKAIDIGIAEDIKCTGLINKKISHGTENMAVGAAMTREEAERAICVGLGIVKELRSDGARIIVSGEMGIGNTTTSAAVASVLLGLPASAVTGRGAGLDNAGLARKISVIERAAKVNRPDKNDALDVLAKLGGLDIAGMVGLFLGGAVYHIPVIIDGAISAVAALLAKRISPDCTDYMLASHVSAEPVGRLLLDAIGAKPVITAEMRLGEGTGGIMLLPLLDGALSVYNNAHRFDEIGLERYTPKC